MHLRLPHGLPRTLTLQNLPTTTFYLYLALYNLIYVVPLLGSSPSLPSALAHAS